MKKTQGTKTLTAAVVLCVGLLQFSQAEEPEFPALQTETPKSSSIFLLDPSRLKINHTISSSYTSIGGRGIFTNLYQANINYKLANPLDVRVTLGVANSQGSFFGPKRGASSILPGFQLHYHPSNNFNLIINYQQYPAGYYPYDPLDYRR
jgi:hypothetical protein